MKARPGHRFQGLVRGRTPRGEMNKTETAYAEVLERRRLDGEIRIWRYEAVKFRIGSGAFYTPDFEVVTADGFLEYHEAKGGMWDIAARVRIKAAAHKFSDRLFIVAQKRTKKDGGGWNYEEIKS